MGDYIGISPKYEEALLVARDAELEDLRGRYPMACRVLAKEAIAAKEMLKPWRDVAAKYAKLVAKCRQLGVEVEDIL